MCEALNNTPSNILVMGNIDPVGVFKLGNAEKVEEATTELLQATDSAANFVISSGCDVPPLTPFANIEAFYNAIDKFNNR